MIWDGSANIGIVKAERHEPEAQIVIASIQSASRDNRLIDLKEASFDLCIIDEAHHSAAPTYERLVRELGFLLGDPNKLLLGVTATPKRGDGVGLSSIFEEIVFNRSIAWGIRNGYLSPLVGSRVYTRVSLNGVQTQAGDFVASQLARTINVPGRNKLIVDSFIQHGSNRKKIVAFCADVKHAVDLAASFKTSGIPSATVHGRMDIEDRRRILQDFADGKIRILTNCGVLTEGFDCPEIDAILLCRPTKSQGLYVQCVGRGTRVSPGKTNCLVMDFVDASRLGLCNFENSLEGIVSPNFEIREKKPKELVEEEAQPVEVFSGAFETSDIKEIDFFNRSSFAWVQVGDAWHLSVGDRRDIWVRKVSTTGYRVILNDDQRVMPLAERELPLSYALGVAEDWVRNQRAAVLARKDAPWRNDPASEKQIAALLKFGVAHPVGLTKGAASDLLQERFCQRRGRVSSKAF